MKWGKLQILEGKRGREKVEREREKQGGRNAGGDGEDKEEERENTVGKQNSEERGL